jgi:hypothetical protein
VACGTRTIIDAASGTDRVGELRYAITCCTPGTRGWSCWPTATSPPRVAGRGRRHRRRPARPRQDRTQTPNLSAVGSSQLRLPHRIAGGPRHHRTGHGEHRHWALQRDLPARHHSTRTRLSTLRDRRALSAAMGDRARHLRLAPPTNSAAAHAAQPTSTTLTPRSTARLHGFGVRLTICWSSRTWTSTDLSSRAVALSSVRLSRLCVVRVRTAGLSRRGLPAYRFVGRPREPRPLRRRRWWRYGPLALVRRGQPGGRVARQAACQPPTVSLRLSSSRAASNAWVGI